MKKFLRSFYVKLSAVFLVLLLLMGAVQVWISIRAARDFQVAADQTLNLELAASIASEFEPSLRDSIDMAAIEHMIHYMMVINPKIEIYLLDGAGKILAFFAGPEKKLQTQSVDLEPVRSFIEGTRPFPILGDDPRHTGRKKIFSAAPLRIGKQTNGYLYVVAESEQYDAAASALRQSYIGQTVVKGILISIVVTGILGLILFGVTTRRLHRITKVVQDFEKGKLNERIPVTRQDEISYLAASFNKLADTIVANMDELRKTDQLRRELVANVSHDLRNPLASIKGYLETIQLKDEQLNPRERQKYIDAALQVSGMLENLIEQLFQLSRLDAEQIELQPEPFSLADLLQDVFMKFTPLAEKKGVHLSASLPKQLPQTYADIGLIERVLSNLLDNALRYTPSGGKISVEIVHVGNRVSIKVSDTGQGIKQEELPLIFDRFYRVEKSRSRTTGGAGLGLAIAQKILELHQSSISVESQLKVGTSFSFQLNTWPKTAYS